MTYICFSTIQSKINVQMKQGTERKLHIFIVKTVDGCVETFLLLKNMIESQHPHYCFSVLTKTQIFRLMN